MSVCFLDTWVPGWEPGSEVVVWVRLYHPSPAFGPHVFPFPALQLTAFSLHLETPLGDISSRCTGPAVLTAHIYDDWVVTGVIHLM